MKNKNIISVLITDNTSKYLAIKLWDANKLSYLAFEISVQKLYKTEIRLSIRG